jgi:hypothetical protein
MFYVRTTTYRARTGPVDTKMMYPCAHCGVQSTAIVRAEGTASSVAVYGAGGSAEAARRKAFESAHATALQSLRVTACPACRQLQPFVLSEFAEADRRLRWRRRVGRPLAAGVALALGLLVAIPGILDVRHSMGLLVVALGVTLAAGGIGLGSALRGWRSPLRPGGSVWFWWAPPPGYREAGTPSWVVAPPPASVPQVTQAPANGLVFGLLAGGAGMLTALVGLCVWAASFSTVYVVNAAPAPLVVRVDGKEVGRVAPSAGGSSKDVAYESFEVRAGEPHHLELVSAASATPGGPPQTPGHSYDLAPNKGNAHGWLVAPASMAAGLCVVEKEAVYGAGEPADAELLNARTDVVELARSYDDLFQASPSSISTDASSVRRWALRGLFCDSLEEGKKPVTFRLAPRHP